MKKLLFTSLIFVLGLSAAHATKRYVGFGTPATGDNLRTALTAAASGKDTVYVAAGVYNSGNAPFVVAAGVKLIGGYAKNDSATLTRRYPGQFMFLPTSSSDLSNTTEFTVLDGNSLKTKASQKHRVLEVQSSATDTGVVDGCLIRNGHVRNDNGGGVLLKGGKLYNSIVRGNVAMADHPDSLSYDLATKVKKGSLGGGVYITNNGEMVNCLVAYNMANDGFGVALGTGSGKTINNTLTANTYAPFFAKIEKSTTGYQMYQGQGGSAPSVGEAWKDYRGATGNPPKWAPTITFSKDFYLSKILTTESQYAVFCAAIDIVKDGNKGTFPIDSLRKIPLESGGTVEAYYSPLPTGDTWRYLLEHNVPSPNSSGLVYTNGIWHPHLDTRSMEYPMGKVSWYGALAYSVWLGGGLPTEARWEFAARRNPGGTGANTVNENLYSGAYGSTVSAGITESTAPYDTVTWRILDTIAWVDITRSIDPTTGMLNTSSSWGSRVQRPHEVARKRPNAVGLYDMTGLMEEWCADAIVTGATTSPYSSSDDPNPASNTTESHSVRGGLWYSSNRFELALNYRIFAGYTSQNRVGFRPFIDLAQQP